MADALLQHTIDEGTKAIDGFAPSAMRLAEHLVKNPPKSLVEVAKEMAPLVDGAKTSTNPKCAALAEQVREEAAIATAAFRAAEMWLKLKSPSVSDGNNFGVDVQNYVISELVAMRTQMDAFIIASRDYHYSRAEGVGKLFAGNKSDESTSESSEVADGKTTKKSTTKTEKNASTPPGQADYKSYIVGLDVKAYHTAFDSLTDIKNNYLKAHVLFAKNMKRLADPRGEGEDGSRVHSMSMF